eukprot:COSAG02_NODE_48635_length_332_cov_0.879828_2_plen_44_part_01
MSTSEDSVIFDDVGATSNCDAEKTAFGNCVSDDDFVASTTLNHE